MGIVRKQGVSYEDGGGQVVILNVDGTELTSLNEVGSVVWHELDGVREVEQLAVDLADRFDDVDATTLTADIRSFVDELIKADLVEFTQP